MFFIIPIIKRIFILLRTSIKFVSILTIAVLLVVGLMSFVYRPIYCVELEGREIGYTKNKSELQKRINDYIDNGDGENNIGFVQVDELPSYKLCLLKKEVQTNDDEIVDIIKKAGIAYYKYYAVLRDNEEKYYVSTMEEAENAVNRLIEKQGTNVQNFGIIEKYELGISEFTPVDTIVANLYVEPKPIVTANAISDKKIEIGIALAKPTSGVVTSRYGPRWSRQHRGLDIGASTGTPIYAVYDGTVISSGWDTGGYGNLVKVDHGNGVQSYYAHCSKLLVSAGDTVTKGQLIAEVGSTGNSTGPHLHLEIRVNGVAQNPLNYVSY